MGDSYTSFAMSYGTAAHTTALAGCILRQYRSGEALLSALFNEGVCIALLSDQPSLLASSTRGAAVTTLQQARNGWLLAASCFPSQLLAALDDAGADGRRDTAALPTAL